MGTRSSVRLSQRQFERLVGLESERLPIAEIHRRWACWAVENGLTRPSYERTRTLVHELRRFRRHQVRTRDVLLDIAFRHRDPRDLEAHLSGLPIPRI
jgi:hypothetical protein